MTERPSRVRGVIQPMLDGMEVPLDQTRVYQAIINSSSQTEVPEVQSTGQLQAKASDVQTTSQSQENGAGVVVVPSSVSKFYGGVETTKEPATPRGYKDQDLED